MKTIQLICLSFAILIGIALGLVTIVTPTTGAEPFRTDINPALQYSHAFILTPDLAAADRDYLFNSEWRGQKLPERFGALIARYDNQFRLLHQAAHSTVPCDWGLDLTQGPLTLLPHLARIKAVSQAARLRAMWKLQQGRPADARDDLLAAFALARNASRDGTFIAALVQIASESIICSAIAENFHQFPTETLKQLIDGFDAAPPRGTVAACVLTEKAFFPDWLIGRITDLQKEFPGNDARVMAAAHELCASLEGPPEGETNQVGVPFWDQVTKASGGTSEGVLKLIRDSELLYPRVAEILNLPPASYAARMKDFAADVKKSSNPFVALIFPAYERTRPKEFAALVRLAFVRAAIEYRLRGEDGLKNVIDPCGNGPFSFRRFFFDGIDRGFELKSAYDGRGFPEVLIFIEKEGPLFRLEGPNPGKALSKNAAAK